MSILAVIPARLQSTRFPDKPLVPLLGVPLVRRTALRVLESGRADEVVVSTDDERIAALVEDLPLEVDLDHRRYRSGSDRVAAVARRRSAEVIVNVQVDEVLVDGEMIDIALSSLEWADIGTVSVPLRACELTDPHVVKIALPSSEEGRVLDFARLVGASWEHAFVTAHAGIYAFGYDVLQRFARLSTGLREACSHLEQLRALDRGWPIFVGCLQRELVAVNIPEDAARAEQALAQESKRNNAQIACANASKGP
ncbi:MAG: NTP transferase domain-containing protein [Deltaproteobacteria bacterium]|nr:NTP transferase domain-containing protein [Deltaproteobacteria bacterium]